ncbi:hypothetical protein [Cognatiluteimonas profundi]|uniref:nSTAND1 domain-containing NTPase n=1 Tax=Cognatiluteimonas profundi TaxID=2594501 RepID=UPI00131C5862|nr:hypothetical protein [Lysobacter profundi]
MSATTGDTDVTIDPQNPWLGLFSYSEETRAYFHGRDEETGELARRVQRKLLTILFGQSGLGKTSLLRAGIVPRLRVEGYCPIYVRVDYAPESPSPSEQIKQAILRATDAAGVWTRPGAAIEGESLWEFLHHRGDLLRDADGRPLIPLLIFDQFEEVFTLAQADDTGRMRAKQFLDDLADLVENRPPAALEARIEHDDSAAEDFDFARADYRVLIALREDYLAHLEGVKGSMPSITQNRMRLARMTGPQALNAVVEPGGQLVSREVAEAIVRFVAGGSELANAEIEPSLLSLVCRELNTVRLSQGRDEISADLLAGSRDTILSEFYERALADQPAGVRRVIEDELLTESGYRESLAEERLIKALAAAGAAPDSLAKLVDRRLLRIEERLDMRRVELTHDVLCSVVLASRTLRQEREARDAAQGQLAAQQSREAATHRALVRARMVAGICAVLMVLAISSAAFGWINLGRARAAEVEAQKSRTNAEKLVSFLIEDFYNELEPTGRLDTLGKLAHMAVVYYDSLPPKLVTPQTQINRAMALVREGAALNSSGGTDAAYRNFGKAQAVFEQLRGGGHASEAVLYGLALTDYNQGYLGVVAGGNGRGTAGQLRAATDLLRPLARAPGASRRVRQLYADTLNVLSHAQPLETAVATCDEARKILVGLGALDLSDLAAASSYADTADSQARHLTSLGRLTEARALEEQVYDLADKILARRPGDLHSLADRSWAAQLLGELAQRQHDDVTAADFANKTVQAGEDEVRFNPSDLSAWQRWSTGLRQTADLQFERGEVRRAIGTLGSLVALEQDKRRPSSLGPTLWYQWIPLARLQANVGNAGGAAQSLRAYARDAAEVAAQSAPGNPRRLLMGEVARQLASSMQLLGGSSQAAFDTAVANANRVGAIVVPADDSIGNTTKHNILTGNLRTAAAAAIRLGQYHQGESLARRWLALPLDPRSGDDPQIGASQARVALAHAVARQGRAGEVRNILQPALAYYEHEQQAGAKGTSFRRDYAYALYVSALGYPSDRTKRQSALDKAATLIAGASAEAKALLDMREVSGLVATTRSNPAM